MKAAKWVPLSFAILSAATSASASTQWRVGQEREVDEGYYMTLFSQSNGWSVWRTETQNGVSCKAVKAAEGFPQPIPVGVLDLLYRGTPFVTISQNVEAFRRQGDRQALSVRLHGRWRSGHTREWRFPGERFWREPLASDDLVEGQRIEVHVETWEYYSLLVGREDERGIIDLTGLDEALQSLVDCHPDLLSDDELTSRPVTLIEQVDHSLEYPSSAMRQGIQGSVRYRLLVSGAGEVSSCEVLESSGSEILDRATCRHMERYARFSPATNEFGEAVQAVFEGTMTWALP